MSEEKYKSLLLEKAQVLGFIGFDGRNYHFVGGLKTTSPEKAFKELGFPETFRREEKYRELYIAFPDFEREARLWLRSVPVPGRKIQNPDGDESLSSVDTIDLVKDIAVYKTLVNMKYDKHSQLSGGYSVVAVNVKTRTLLDFSTISPDALLTSKGMDREELIQNNNIVSVIPKFNPLCADLTFQGKDENFGSENTVTYINTAVPPFWMKNPDYKDTAPAVSPFIEKLLNHLFPEKDELEKVLDWCHYAVTSRNGTILCLAGPRGTGKSTFADILSLIVGTNYSETIGESALKDKFNSQLKNKRLAIFEEVSLKDQEYVNKLKAWCNDRISVETKGKDATTVDNWASIMFLMNDISNLVIQYQERRFSIPRVAEVNFNRVMSMKEISDFKEGIRKEEFETMKQVAAFGRFLFNRVPKISNQDPIKGEYYRYVADVNMSEWQTRIRDHVLLNGEIDIPINPVDIFPELRHRDGEKTKYIPKRPAIEKWLNDYQYGTEAFRIGKVVDWDPPKDDKRAVINSQRRNSLMGFEQGQNIPRTITQRKYAILPNPDLLKKYGKKYNSLQNSVREEDLL